MDKTEIENYALKIADNCNSQKTLEPLHKLAEYTDTKEGKQLLQLSATYLIRRYMDYITRDYRKTTLSKLGRNVSHISMFLSSLGFDKLGAKLKTTWDEYIRTGSFKQKKQKKQKKHGLKEFLKQF